MSSMVDLSNVQTKHFANREEIYRHVKENRAQYIFIHDIEQNKFRTYSTLYTFDKGTEISVYSKNQTANFIWEDLYRLKIALNTTEYFPKFADINLEFEQYDRFSHGDQCRIYHKCQGFPSNYKFFFELESLANFIQPPFSLLVDITRLTVTRRDS